MIKHIVSFKLKAEYKDKALQIKSELENLPQRIPEIKFLEVGINITDLPSAFDLILVSEFNSVEDLNIYREHPKHQEVVKTIALYKQESMLVDYII